MAVQTQIQTRRGTAATWTSTNPTLAAGEIGFESDTNKFKIGTGSTAWTALAYAANLSPLTTKGDLYTYSTDNTRLAVGNNGDTLVVDSSTSTGLRYQGLMAAGKNACINGGFDIWQRGTSFTVGAAFPYTADRWQVIRSGVAAGMTVTRQVTGDTTNLPFIQYCARVQRDSGNTSTAYLDITQSFESNQSIPFAGKTVTLSFYARKGADYSSASNALNYRMETGTGTDQNVVTAGYTGSAVLINATATLTATWQRFQTTATVSATATEFALRFRNTPVGTAGTNDYFEITGVQIEVGAIATQFGRTGGTIQGELAACQRYYWRFTPTVTTRLGSGYVSSTVEGIVQFIYPVPMRIAPTALEQSGTAADYSVANATTTICSTVPTFLNANVSIANVSFMVSSGLVVNQAIQARPINTTSYLGWSAEL
jgi:hypothetical protein